MSTLTAKIQLRRDTSANWTSNNPILLAGEVAFTSDVFYTGTDQQRFKIGDGVQTWTQLDYVPEGGAGYPEHLYLTVVNKTGDNLLASGYKVMKVSAAQVQRLEVDYALADSNGNSTDTIGIVFENINNNQTGKLITVGEIIDVNTTGSLQGQTWADGDVLYLDSTIPGNLTNIQPTAPNHLVVMGYVVYAHQNQGKIYVKITNGFEIGELHNCYLPSPTNNDSIFWSSGTNRYENKSIQTILGGTPRITLNKLTDSTVFTGTTVNTILDSILVPANTFKIGVIDLKVRNVWTTNISSKTTRIYINTSNSLSGATLLGTHITGTTGLSVDIGRYLAIKNLTTIQVFNSTTTQIANEAVGTTAVSSITFNNTVNNYIIVAMQHASTGDSCINSYISLEI